LGHAPIVPAEPQLILALVGWAAACYMLHFAFRGPRRAFVGLMTLAQLNVTAPNPRGRQPREA
jgi:hypothetical protein